MNEKQQLAATIKDLTQALQRELEKATAMGLAVKLNAPRAYSLGLASALEIKLTETLSY